MAQQYLHLHVILSKKGYERTEQKSNRTVWTKHNMQVIRWAKTSSICKKYNTNQMIEICNEDGSTELYDINDDMLHDRITRLI